jgi:hypothetical protein
VAASASACCTNTCARAARRRARRSSFASEATPSDLDWLPASDAMKRDQRTGAELATSAFAKRGHATPASQEPAIEPALVYLAPAPMITNRRLWRTGRVGYVCSHAAVQSAATRYHPRPLPSQPFDRYHDPGRPDAVYGAFGTASAATWISALTALTILQSKTKSETKRPNAARWTTPQLKARATSVA